MATADESVRNVHGEIIFGNNLRINGDGNSIVGNGNTIIGDNNNVAGNNNELWGNDSRVIGNNNKVLGENNFILGISNIAHGNSSRDQNSSGSNSNRNSVDGSTSSEEEGNNREHIGPNANGPNSNFHAIRIPSSFLSEVFGEIGVAVTGAAGGFLGANLPMHVPSERPSSGNGKGILPIYTSKQPSGIVCQICSANVNVGEKFRILSCSHLFHMTCIDPWLGSHSKCPMCEEDLGD